MPAASVATIATASNFRWAMSDLINAFEASHPHQLQQVNASSGILFNQITFGAPFDVMLSANSRYPQQLEQLNLAVPESRFTYAEGKLVLAFNDTMQAIPCSFSNDKHLPTAILSCFTAALTTVRQQRSKLAVANPDIAPYGIAAQQALQHLGLWDVTRQHLVRGSNVGQAYQFVATGNTAAGFVALSQMSALQNQASDSLAYWRVPENWYQPIRQQAILLQSGKKNLAALSFLVFLKTGEAKDIIERHGYTTR